MVATVPGTDIAEPSHGRLWTVDEMQGLAEEVFLMKYRQRARQADREANTKGEKQIDGQTNPMSLTATALNSSTLRQ